MARSNNSVTARTTGAPLAMSRRLSRSSASPPANKASAPAGLFAFRCRSGALSSAMPSAVSISSKAAISRTVERPSVSSMVRSTLVSEGSATARCTLPSCGLIGKDEEFAQKARGETVEQGAAFAHGRERGTRQAVKLGHGVGKGRRLHPAALIQARDRRRAGGSPPRRLSGVKSPAEIRCCSKSDFTPMFIELPKPGSAPADSKSNRAALPERTVCEARAKA